MKRITAKTLTIALFFLLSGCTLVTDFEAPDNSLYSIRDNLTNDITINLNEDIGTLDLDFDTILPQGNTDAEFLALIEEGVITVTVQNTDTAVSFNLITDGNWSESPSSAGDYYMEIMDEGVTLRINFFNEVSTGESIHVGGNYDAMIDVTNANDYFLVETGITRTITVQ